MKVLTLLTALAVPALIAVATFVPEAAPHGRELTLAALAAAGLVVLLIAALPTGKSTAAPVRAAAAQPTAAPVAANQAEAEIATFLGILQEKGRFVDFLMEDITRYDDKQVGAVARVVHAGCRDALREHADIAPVRDEAEGSLVTIQAGYGADEYRFVGKISGEAPFKGKLVHRGWRARSVKLPRVLKPQGDRLPTIAPAEVDLG